MRIAELHISRWLSLVAVSFLILGCSMLPDHKDDFTKVNEDFMLRMRWHDIVGASKSFAPEPQEEFLNRFEALDDLKVMDFTAARSEAGVEIGLEWKKVHYLMEYHFLPSLSVKQKRFTLRWEKAGEAGAWTIVEPFPDLK